MSAEALRAAYLRAVGAHPPTHDPDGFTRVRAAYELLRGDAAQDAVGADALQVQRLVDAVAAALERGPLGAAVGPATALSAAVDTPYGLGRLPPALAARVVLTLELAAVQEQLPEAWSAPFARAIRTADLPGLRFELGVLAAADRDAAARVGAALQGGAPNLWAAARAALEPARPTRERLDPADAAVSPACWGTRRRRLVIAAVIALAVLAWSGLGAPDRPCTLLPDACPALRALDAAAAEGDCDAAWRHLDEVERIEATRPSVRRTAAVDGVASRLAQRCGPRPRAAP